MEKRARRKKNTQAIRRLGELLRDAMDSYVWEDFVRPAKPSSMSQATEPEADVGTNREQQGAEEGHNEEHDEADDYGDDYVEPEYYVDPADIQGTIDEATSSFVKEKLIKKFDDPKRPPTLADIFSDLFGSNSELKKQAEYFEELISGYEDRAHVDDLGEAYQVLEAIVDEICPKNS